ncbi:O-antigen ligase family protein [Persephonella sp.]
MDIGTLKEYLEGEGRIFLYYLPLIYFSLVYANFRNIKFMDKILYSVVFISFLFVILWSLGIGKEILSIGKDFSGLITSHTAAGTFFGTIFLYIFLKALRKNERKDYIISLIAFIPLFLSASRQAILAVITVIFLYFIFEKQLKKFLFLFLVLCVIGIAGSETRGVERFKSLISYEFFSLVPLTIERIEPYKIDKSLARDLSDNEAITNALNRIILWGKAVLDFKSSPLIGIGFGRYNDKDLDFCGIPQFIYIACSAKENVYDVTSAHNSYLHFLSELGILGLITNMLIWIHLIRTLNKFERNFQKYSIYFSIAKYIVVFTLINAFFGHALAAPAIGFVSLSIIGLIYSFGFYLGRNVYETKLYIHRT